MLSVVVFVGIFPLLTGNRDMDEFVCAGSDCISIAQVSWQVEGIESLFLHSISWLSFFSIQTMFVCLDYVVWTTEDYFFFDSAYFHQRQRVRV